MLFAGFAVAEYRMAPHMQPPWMSSLNLPPPPALAITPDPGFLSHVCGRFGGDCSGRQPKKKEPRYRGALAARKRGSCSAAFGLWRPVGFQAPRTLVSRARIFSHP